MVLRVGRAVRAHGALPSFRHLEVVFRSAEGRGGVVSHRDSFISDLNIHE